MSRGLEGRKILKDIELKKKFLEILRANSEREDHFFMPLAQVYQALERRWGIRVDEIDTGTHEGKRLRGELLASIRMNCGFRCSEIIELPIFSDVSQGTLGSMYWHAKKRERGNTKS